MSWWLVLLAAEITGPLVVTFNDYAGTGLAPSPAPGALDSDDWQVAGLSDGDSTWGGTHLAGDFARGVADGDETIGGLYAAEVRAGDRGFGWQAHDTDLTPGRFTLALVNATGAAITDAEIRYEVWSYNDRPSATVVRLGWSLDGVTFTDLPGAAVTTPGAADDAGWVATPVSLTLEVTIPDGAGLWLAWETDAVDGAGERDQLAIDDLHVDPCPTCPQVCGDGVVGGDEGCDDGDLDGGDGCDGDCQVEPGWSCDGSPSICGPFCGDGVVLGGEGCDDGDAAGDDGCSAACQVEPGWTCPVAGQPCAAVCGDGARLGDEACDDGDLDAGDGCGPDCAIEHGFSCDDTLPSICSSTCGDGLVAADEGCDDGGQQMGDGCDDTCAVDAGWACAGEPSACVQQDRCGDGVVDDNELCDDGGLADGDGCSATCRIEDGAGCAGEPSVCFADRDGDGDADDTDSCPDDWNPSQADVDGDGLGDACDPSDDRAGEDGGCCGAGGDPAGPISLFVLSALAVLCGPARCRRSAP